MSNVKLLPLPDKFSHPWLEAHGVSAKDYARANVEANLAAKQAEHERETEALRAENAALKDAIQQLHARDEALRAEVEMLREDARRNSGCMWRVQKGYTSHCQPPKNMRDVLARAERLRAEVEALTSAIDASNTACIRWADVVLAQEDRAERLAEALRLAEEHIDALTPEWYSAGQRVLAAIRAALHPTTI